jgi:hypothetical protein
MIKRFISNYLKGRDFQNDPIHQATKAACRNEQLKSPSRTEVINFLLSLSPATSNYLEIGVRNPKDNFDKINANRKYSVDPGFEHSTSQVDFRITSDEFFALVAEGAILTKDVTFDVIFIDGLHLAEQVDRDITNSLNHLSPKGFIVLHDCNPPTEWNARESYRYGHSPAGTMWNGTTWKAFLKWRFNSSVNSCCVDTDWGVGIISKDRPIGVSIPATNPFFEFHNFDEHRATYLNLIDFEALKSLIGK